MHREKAISPFDFAKINAGKSKNEGSVALSSFETARHLAVKMDVLRA
jgi:hypothetical protein